MAVFLINPSDHSFGTAVITPRWLYVLAAATPRSFGDPVIVDETLEALVPSVIEPGDFVGIGIHTGNALRGYEVGRQARERGAWVIYGGIHATLYPEEALDRGHAHCVVKGDGDVIWSKVLEACVQGKPKQIYEGGRIDADQFVAARWDLLPPDKYMWASVQTVRGCPKHCSFCSVWRTDGQKPRQRSFESVIEEIVQLRRKGFRYIALADDNFYPVTLTDLRLAREQKNYAKLAELEQIRSDKFALMAEMAKLPKNMVFFTQITMESAEDPEYLDAMRNANIKGALVGVEAVTPEGLKSVFKEFNFSGEGLVKQLQTFRQHGLHMLGSFIFGLPSDKPDTFKATADLAARAGLAFAQFVMLTPFPGTVDFLALGEGAGEGAGVRRRHPAHPILADSGGDPAQDVYAPHAHELAGDQRPNPGGMGSLLQLFFYLETIGLRADAARPGGLRLPLQALPQDVCRHRHQHRQRAPQARQTRGARWLSRYTRKFFISKPMPELAMPVWATAAPAHSPAVELGPFSVLD